MALGSCPACGGTFAPKAADPSAQVCGGCGATFLAAPKTATAPSRWGAWNLGAHLVLLLGGFLWLDHVAPRISEDFGEGASVLMFMAFVAYAGFTTLIAVLARNLRFSTAVVHAPALAWLVWTAVPPAVTRPAPVTPAPKPPALKLPGLLTLTQWRVYRTQGNAGYAQLELDPRVDGHLVVESLEALRGETVVGHIHTPRPAQVSPVSSVIAIPFLFDAPERPDRFRVSLLVYPAKLERPCRTGENGEPLGETPIRRVVLDTEAEAGPTKLGTQPQECGPLEAVSYRLMAPTAYPP